MTSKATAAKTLDPKIKAGIRSVKAFHDLGTDSLKKDPGRLGHEAQDEAERLGVTADYLRKARAFADPERGYREQELKVLFTLSKKRKYVLGVSLVTRLLSISDRRERAAIQRKVLQGAWSVNRLEQEILVRYGRRKEGGRRRPIPDDRRARLAQLELLCLPWRRWNDDLNLEIEEAGEELFPKQIRVPLTAAIKQIDAIQKYVKAGLRRPPAAAR